MKSPKVLAVAFLLFSILTVQLCASPFTLGFSCITGNAPATALIGEQQLRVEVIPVDAVSVKFVVSNMGPSQSTVAEVYFDGAVLQGIVSVLGSEGVTFVEGAKPANLPAGNSLTPAFNADFSVEAIAAGPKYGVNPYEYLDVVCLMADGKTFDDVTHALAIGDLRVGIHAINIEYQGSALSEGFVSIPEPATMSMLALGALGLCLRRRRS